MFPKPLPRQTRKTNGKEAKGPAAFWVETKEVARKAVSANQIKEKKSQCAVAEWESRAIGEESPLQARESNMKQATAEENVARESYGCGHR